MNGQLRTRTPPLLVSRGMKHSSINEVFGRLVKHMKPKTIVVEQPGNVYLITDNYWFMFSFENPPIRIAVKNPTTITITPYIGRVLVASLFNGIPVIVDDRGLRIPGSDIVVPPSSELPKPVLLASGGVEPVATVPTGVIAPILIPKTRAVEIDNGWVTIVSADQVRLQWGQIYISDLEGVSVTAVGSLWKATSSGFKYIPSMPAQIAVADEYLIISTKVKTAGMTIPVVYGAKKSEYNIPYPDGAVVLESRASEVVSATLKNENIKNKEIILTREKIIIRGENFNFEGDVLQSDLPEKSLVIPNAMLHKSIAHIVGVTGTLQWRRRGGVYDVNGMDGIPM